MATRKWSKFSDFVEKHLKLWNQILLKSISKCKIMCKGIAFLLLDYICQILTPHAPVRLGNQDWLAPGLALNIHLETYFIFNKKSIIHCSNDGDIIGYNVTHFLSKFNYISKEIFLWVRNNIDQHFCSNSRVDKYEGQFLMVDKQKK